MERNHLFLALSSKGWGEAILGRTIAAELQKLGDRVFFICNASMETLFSSGGFDYETITDNLGPLVRVLIENRLIQERFDTIVLSDFTTCEQVCRRLGVDSRFLLEFGVPVIAMDTWDQSLTGSSVDLFWEQQRTIHNWFDGVHRIVPVPFAHITHREGFYRHLPAAISQPRKVMQHVRDALGLSSGEKLLMISTADWQQAEYNNPDGDRIARLVPLLLSYYLSRVPGANLVHVGPRPFEIVPWFSAKYHWRPQMPKRQFEVILGSSDLFLSLNASATTITSTIASRIPTVVLQNKIKAESLSGASEQLLVPPSDFVKLWIEKAVPIYRFRMWPLGLFDFFEPLLRGNKYASTFRSVEILDEEVVVSTITDLLHNSESREYLFRACSDYWRSVASLPTGAEVITKIAGSSSS